MSNRIKYFYYEHSDWIQPLSVLILSWCLVLYTFLVYDHRSVIDTIYFGVVTATTVGFGDVCATSPQSKIAVTIYILVSCIAFVTFFQRFWLKVNTRHIKRLRGAIKTVLNPYVVIIGWPNEDKVRSIIEELRILRPNCAIVCLNTVLEEKTSWMKRYKIDFIKGRGSCKKYLEMANITKTENILVLANDPTAVETDEYTAACVMMCESLNPKAYTIAEKVRFDSDLFKRANCDKVVPICRANELAHEIVNPGAIAFIDSIFSAATAVVQKNIVYEDEDITWSNLVCVLSDEQGVCPVGFALSKDHAFSFAPPKDTVISKGMLIKVIAP